MDALEDALMEVRRAQSALEDALGSAEQGEEVADQQRDEDKIDRLVRVSKSLLNEDGIFTRYDLALAIRDIEGPA
ncbi:hypothetical protein [Deinococcus sp. PEB2-63]